MIKVCVLSQSPTFRSGIAVLVRGIGNFAVEAASEPPPSGNRNEEVYVLYADEIDLYQASIADKKVVVIQTRQVDEVKLFEERERGWGIVPYDASGEDLAAAILAVDRDMIVLPNKFLARNSRRGGVVEQTGDRDAGENLTERETEIMQLLGQGYPNKQIALVLGISENTVKYHISSIFSKFGVSNRTEALREGNRRGIISL